MALHLSQLVQLWGAPLNAPAANLNLDQQLGPVCTDSRALMEGSFFVPLVGEKFDGHAFLAEAEQLGAQAAVVARGDNHSVPNGLLHWLVDDTLNAYQQLGLLQRRQLHAPVVAVTGSAGKTTTRELIRSVLSPLGEVLASEGNNNNDIGVPLTLLQGGPKHRAMVVEMGMRGLGEIARLSCCSEPDIAVITNIGSAHIGRLGNRAAIAKAKCEITTCLRTNGLVVIPAGDPLLEAALAQSWAGRVIRVGLQDDISPQIQNNNEGYQPERLPRADLIARVDLTEGVLELQKQRFNLPLEGKHNARNLLLALAVARELNVSWDTLTDLDVDVPGSRNRQLQIDEFTVLDETYNASPEAVIAALELLASKPANRFAVLGTMLELGEQSVELHRQIAERAVQLGLDGLVVVGEGAEAKAMATAASSLQRLAVVDRPEGAAKPLKDWLQAGDVVLLKASRGIELERLLPLLQGNQS